MLVLSILLVTKKVKFFNRCVLSYLKMNGCIKYFEKGGKNMSFIIKNDDISDMNDIDIWEWH